MQELPGNTPGVTYLAYDQPELYLPTMESNNQSPSHPSEFTGSRGNRFPGVMRVVTTKELSRMAVLLSPQPTGFSLIEYIHSSPDVSSESNTFSVPFVYSRSRTLVDKLCNIRVKRQRLDSNLASDSSISSCSSTSSPVPIRTLDCVLSLGVTVYDATTESSSSSASSSEYKE